MKYFVKRTLIGIVSATALPLVFACSSHEKVSETTTYVPAPAAPQIVVQPASPPSVTVVNPSTTSTTTEERSMNSSDLGNTGTAETTSSFKSESTTVTPSSPGT